MVAYRDCRIVDLLSHSTAWSAPTGRKGGLTPPVREERVIQEHKKTTNEASMSLKTQGGHRKTKPKRTNFEPPVSIFDPKTDLSSVTRVRATASRSGVRPGQELPHAARLEEPRANTKNSGNEAKKYLKTKDLTFCNAAN